jgi:hypothetical protein
MATAPDIKPVEPAEPPRLEQTKINGITAFWSPGDGIRERLEEAHALATMFAAAHQVLHEVTDEQGEALQNLNDLVKKRAFEGIATLIAVAQYHLDAYEAGSR